jgi:hypothetical protein
MNFWLTYWYYRIRRCYLDWYYKTRRWLWSSKYTIHHIPIPKVNWKVTKQRKKKTDPYIQNIKVWLREGKSATWMYEQMISTGFIGSMSSVRREARRQRRFGFYIPTIWRRDD